MNARTKEWLEFDEYLSPDTDQAKKYASMNLAQLFEQASKDTEITLEKGDEGTKDEWVSEKIDLSHAGVLYEIYRRLDIIDSDTVKAYVKDQLGDLHRQVEELERQFKNHRHAQDKLYSEKAVW